ncbi:MAG: hypothetical protein JST44_12015 [Cyanobacteria bacterium SZAS LIN-5]|nr:hypothetical protein [Cyanobacteria bacterium SZAS LIN-5]
MGEATRVDMEGQRAEVSRQNTADKHQGAQSEIHAQMDAFRATLKHQATTDHELAAPDARHQGKLDSLYKNINKSVDCLTDLELFDAKSIAHKVNEERKAHHGHSDTLDALKKYQETHKTAHDVGMYNAVVLGAAAEIGSHVNENKYFPASGGKVKSNELPKPPFNNPQDAEKYYQRHPVPKGSPEPIL